MMAPVMMVEENQRLALKPGLSYFSAGQRTAAHEASEYVSSYSIKTATPSSLKSPMSCKFYFGGKVCACAPPSTALIPSEEEHGTASLKHGLTIQNP